jgi:hypothetical protein
MANTTIGTDLQSAVSRLTTLLEQARTTIVNQAAQIAAHVETITSANSVVASVTNDVNAQVAALEALFSGNNVANVVSHVANVVTVEVAKLANAATVPLAAVVANVVPVTFVANAIANTVTTGLAGEIEAGIATVKADIEAAPGEVIHDIEALEAKFKALMANAPVTIAPLSVPVPNQITAIVVNAPVVPTSVNTAPNLFDKIEAGIKNVVEGKEQINVGPVHFKV